ncbi:MAG: hypothetical protein WCO65_03620 [bacterium]
MKNEILTDDFIISQASRYYTRDKFIKIAGIHVFVIAVILYCMMSFLSSKDHALVFVGIILMLVLIISMCVCIFEPETLKIFFSFKEHQKKYLSVLLLQNNRQVHLIKDALNLGLRDGDKYLITSLKQDVFEPEMLDFDLFKEYFEARKCLILFPEEARRRISSLKYSHIFESSITETKIYEDFDRETFGLYKAYNLRLFNYLELRDKLKNDLVIRMTMNDIIIELLK